MEDEEGLCMHCGSMTANGWAKGQPEAQVPAAQVRVPKVRTAGAAASEEQSNYFFVVYHWLIACTGYLQWR